MTDLKDQLQAGVGSRYRVERELGGGGMSRVYLAVEEALGRQVVIKLLPPEFSAGISVDRFRREIQLIASLQHPHIVPLLTAGQAGDLLYYTMPFIEGESLRHRLEREGALPLDIAVRLLRDVVDALNYAHRHGLVHRDIKPDNVLLSHHHAVVTDFGIAKALTEAGAAELTSTGLALGTPAYMAPEQAAADPRVDARADIYAVGVLAYEILAGEPPFRGPTAHAVLAAQMTRAPTPIAEIRRAVPPHLAAVVMRCLQKDPADRWQTAEQLLGQLSDTDRSEAVPSIPVLLPRPSPTLPATLGRFALASAAVLGVAWGLRAIFGLPDWFFPAVIVLLAVGLPIVVVATRRQEPHSLGRAVRGGIVAFSALGVATAGYMLLRTLGVGPVGTLLAKGAIRDKERLLVADFANLTADSLLASAVTEAIRVDFSQSRLVTPVTPDAVQAALQRMRKPPGTMLDDSTARELAQREGIGAVLSGDIRNAGGRVLIAARLVSASDGAVLAAFRETAADTTAVIGAVDRLSQKLRDRMGESLRDLRQEPPLERVTTSSLAALRKYAQADRVSNATDPVRGIPLLEEAVALDSTFAMAWRRIGISYSTIGSLRSQELDAYRKALRYSDHLTEREKYLTEGTYFWATNRTARAITAYESLLELEPNDEIALNNLALALEAQRDYVRAAGYQARAVMAHTLSSTAYANLVDILVKAGMTDSAEQALALMERRLPGHPLAMAWRASLAYQAGDLARGDSIARRMLERTDLPFLGRTGMREVLGQSAAMQGRLAEADRLFGELAAVYEQASVLSGALTARVYAATIRLWYHGRPGEELARTDRLLKEARLDTLPPANRPYTALAELYARGGRPDRGKAYLADYERLVPADERDPGNDGQLEIAKATVAAAENRPHEAADLFRAADRGLCGYCALFGLAQALDRAGAADSAVATYEHFLAVPDMFRIRFDALYRPATYVRLGELYAARGDKQRALDYYGRYVALWKNADPEFQPRVSEIKQRIAELAGEAPR